MSKRSETTAVSISTPPVSLLLQEEGVAKYRVCASSKVAGPTQIGAREANPRTLHISLRGFGKRPANEIQYDSDNP